MSDDRFRGGNHNKRNVYKVREDGSEEHVGCMFTEEMGELVVKALNALARESTR